MARCRGTGQPTTTRGWDKGFYMVPINWLDYARPGIAWDRASFSGTTRLWLEYLFGANGCHVNRPFTNVFLVHQTLWWTCPIVQLPTQWLKIELVYLLVDMSSRWFWSPTDLFRTSASNSHMSQPPVSEQYERWPDSQSFLHSYD